MSAITEWQFTADIASQINEILRNRIDLPFSSASCEERGRGSQKRRDLTIYDRNNRIALTGEVKLPDKRDGRSPIQETLVIDAHRKADQIGVDYFFTWNVNNCVLWKTFEQGKPITERYVEFFDALPAPIRVSDELLHPRVKEQVKRFLSQFLERCAAVISGEEPMLLLPLDEKFIRVWELGLFPLVIETLAAISERYEKDKRFQGQLDKWMREKQGWTLSKEDEEVIRENLERAAKFSCYVLANKIVFYKALRRQFPRLKEMRIPGKIKTRDELKALLADYFAQATIVTRDYETVFQGDFGDSLPCLNEASIESWRDLIEDTDKFDFTQFNYEVIGQIFERMLSTNERHKFGQHYTRSEVVDLINSFCIREPEATILDPACGGGTFLVRAYQRKNDLAKGSLTHQELVNQIYGFDISAYPAHLTTINLATRDLKEGANYPLVARQDFFNIEVNDKVFHIPKNGDEDDDLTEMPRVKVVIGNPPYVRQEKINEYYGSQYKKHLQELARKDAPDQDLSGRSDILCYFFTHGFAFLEDGGYMGLLTSSNWLDTAYGFKLQKFLLGNFEIIAIFESNSEPWFTGARVTTAATILRKQPDAAKRNANSVKFIWLKKPIAEFLTYSQSEDDRRQTFEGIRNRIESLTKEEETEIWRIRVVNQAMLYEAGCLPFDVTEDEEESDESENGTANTSSRAVQAPLIEHHKNEAAAYTGYKWGIYLRAPEIFSKLINRYGDRFVPLGKIAEVRFGVKSGCDAFFFPRDITDDAMSKDISDREFKQRYGIRRSEAKKNRIVEAGDGSVHLIEANYLSPLVFNLMEIDSVGIDTKNLKKSILLVSKDKKNLQGTHILNYIKWGEREGFHQRPTCASREPWYDLNTHQRGNVFWTKSQRYRHIVPLNEQLLIANCNLYDIWTIKNIDAKLLCAVLNSTIVALNKHSFGRKMGGDPLLKTEVADVKMMLVPDPQQATALIQKRLEAAIDSMSKRKIFHLVDVDSEETNWTGELALEDRQQLDDAVLELIGVEDSKERAALRDELYAEITTLYRQIRVAERKMQRHRSATARAGKQTAHSIADEIWDSFAPQPILQTPLDFVPTKAQTQNNNLPTGRAKIVKQHLFQPEGVQIGDVFIELGDPVRGLFVKALADIGISGSVRVPVDSNVCRRALDEYNAYVESTNSEFTNFAAAYTADENLQVRVVNELWKRLKK